MYVEMELEYLVKDNATQRIYQCGSHHHHQLDHHHHHPQSTTTFLYLLLLLLSCISLTLAAPQTSCILCDKDDLQAKDPLNSETYEEFTFDHQVSRQEAILALRKFNETHGPKNACNSMKCTPDVLKYCLGPQFINDHCWCELQHRDEGLPYVPHICYAGEKVYTSSVGSCFHFEEVKECCCASALAKEWRHISGKSLCCCPTILLIVLVSCWSLFAHRTSWRS
ncbi:uncharacterized protein [Drosophila tropicalis]|uniref:uncharacterized protein isoform X1 n=2 Tax=Drosophila tropicalis TaxID=46794 RepID=UPI0035ABB397